MEFNCFKGTKQEDFMLQSSVGFGLAYKIIDGNFTDVEYTRTNSPAVYDAGVKERRYWFQIQMVKMPCRCRFVIAAYETVNEK